MLSHLQKLWKPDDRLWTPATRIVECVGRGVHDGINLLVMRRNRRGGPYVQSSIRCGPNSVHAYIAHKDGGWTPQALADTMLPAFKSALYPLDRSQDVFNWEPL